MAEEARVTALVGEVMAGVTGEARVTAMVGEVMAGVTGAAYVTALVGEVMVFVEMPGPATGRKYGPAIQCM